MPRGYRRATTAQTVDAARIIKENADVTPLGVKYNEGYNDEHIAAIVGCGKSSVERIRRDLYGCLFTPLFEATPVPATLEDYFTHVKKLREAMRAMLDSHNALLDEFGKLPLDLNF